MLRIMVCDDNLEYLELFKGYITEALKETGIQGEIVLYTDNPGDAIKYLKTNSANVFFLDIIFDNDQRNGIDLGRAIRDAESDPYIIYISEQMDYVLKVFKTRPFDFLPKPVTYEILKSCMIDIERDRKRKEERGREPEKTIIVKSGANLHSLKIDNIIYIEKMGSKAIIHMVDRDIACYESLEYFENCLSENGNFIRCHKSFIANRKYIAEIRKSKREIAFTNGNLCYIGRKYKGVVIFE